MSVPGGVKSMSKGPYVGKTLASLKTWGGQWGWSLDGEGHKLGLNESYAGKCSRRN